MENILNILKILALTFSISLMARLLALDTTVYIKNVQNENVETIK